MLKSCIYLNYILAYNSTILDKLCKVFSHTILPEKW